jgi:hypothetical protein
MAISPPRVALSVRPRDPTPIWLLLRLCVFATIALSGLGVVADVFEALVAPYDYGSDFATQVWYFWYAYAAYATWLIFFLTLIFLMWLTYRLARNLHALAPNKFTLSPTYAVGYYLVPIANIFMPPRMTGLIARDTFTAATAPSHHNALIGWWWGVFLLAALLSNVAAVIAANSGAYDASESFDDAAYASSLWLGAAAWVANIVALLFYAARFRATIACASRIGP